MMTKDILKLAGAAAIALMASTGVTLADQARPRNPGADSGGSSGGSSSGGDTGRTAAPRGGGSSPWSGGESVSSAPARPASEGSRTRARRGGDDNDNRRTGGTAVPAYSRPRGGATVTGRAIPRTSIGTLPPVVSGPIYWTPGDSWYFYPWGFGGLGLGYLWDPWAWGGYGGYWGAGYPYGAYGPGYGYGSGYGGYGGYGSGYGYGGGGGGSYSSSSGAPVSDVTGNLRLKVKPREAEVIVDGFFAGRVDDFDGAFQKLALPAGPHRVELKAEGYETLVLDVLVVEDETTTYKGDLTEEP